MVYLVSEAEAPAQHHISAAKPLNIVRNVAITTPAQPPTAQDWDRFRPIITSIYRNQTTKETLQLLSSRYSFVATKRMLMRRVAAWGICKNTKAWQREAASRLLQEQYGRADAIRLEDGCLISRSKIRRHRRLSAKRRTFGDGSCTPNYGKCWTIDEKALLHDVAGAYDLITLPSPALPIIETRTIDSVEPLMIDIDNYFRSYFERGPGFSARRACSTSPVIEPIHPLRESATKKGVYSDLNPARLLDQYNASLKIMRRGNRKLGWKYFDELFDIAHPMFQEQHPRLISRLLVMSRVEATEFEGLYNQLWTHFSNLAAIIHGHQHPISKLCRFLGHSKSKSGALELLLQQNVKALDPHLARHDKVYVRTRLNHIDHLLKESHKAVELQHQLHEIVKQCEHVYGHDHKIVRSALCRLAWLQEDFGSLRTAEEIHRDIIDRSTRSLRDVDTDRNSIRAHVRLASMLSRHGRHQDAGHFLRKALHDCRSQFGAEDYETMDILGDLTETLEAQGRHDDVLQLERNYSEVLEA
jgi:hypothetical protein